MVYIPKKTLHIRHEDVDATGSYSRCAGRWWFGTDTQFTNHPYFAYSYTAGQQTASANLTGTRTVDGNIEPLISSNLGTTWGFPRGTFQIEHEILVSLASTADPLNYRLRTGSTWSTDKYTPRITIHSSYSRLAVMKRNMRWIDYTENSVNYRIYKQEFELTVDANGYAWNEAANIQFGVKSGSNFSTDSNHILTMPFEDIKIIQLD